MFGPWQDHAFVWQRHAVRLPWTGRAHPSLARRTHGAGAFPLVHLGHGAQVSVVHVLLIVVLHLHAASNQLVWGAGHGCICYAGAEGKLDRVAMLGLGWLRAGDP